MDDLVEWSDAIWVGGVEEVVPLGRHAMLHAEMPKPPPHPSGASGGGSDGDETGWFGMTLLLLPSFLPLPSLPSLPACPLTSPHTLPP